MRSDGGGYSLAGLFSDFFPILPQRSVYQQLISSTNAEDTAQLLGGGSVAVTDGSGAPTTLAVATVIPEPRSRLWALGGAMERGGDALVVVLWERR